MMAAQAGLEYDKYKSLYSEEGSNTKVLKHKLMTQAIENVKNRGEEPNIANLNKEKNILFREAGVI